MKSKPYKIAGKTFRYDYKRNLVELIQKADKHDLEVENEWKETHGYSLLDIDSKGYMILMVAGLELENWSDKEARDEYLTGWAEDIDDECSSVAADFVKYELPYYEEIGAMA